MSRDPEHKLVPDDRPLLKGLVVVRYRDPQGYGIELLLRLDESVRLPDGTEVPVQQLRSGDRFREHPEYGLSVVTSIRIGDSSTI